MNCSLLIIDHQPLKNQKLKRLIESEPGYTVVGQVQDLEEAVKFIEDNHPDVTLIDISLQGIIGFHFFKDLLLLYPDLKLIIISKIRKVILAERVLQAGARAYVLKENLNKEISKAIKKVLAGGIYISEVMNRDLLLHISGHDKSNIVSLDQLTDRELEVFDLMGHGLNNKEIALLLDLSTKTVESYRVKIRNKLKLKKIKDLQNLAAQWVEKEMLV